LRPVERGAYEAELRRVAKTLGLPLRGDLEGAIIEHCKARFGQWVAMYGQPTTLADLLALAAACLNVEVVEIHNDADLQELLRQIPPEREPVMARLQAELDDNTDGVMIRRQHHEPWEKPFLAVIHCRGWHAFRRFFSKWHEVVHLLIEGPRLSVAFRQTRVQELRQEPEEVLVDRVAAALAFYPDIFEPVFLEELGRCGRLTFEVIDETRERVAPEASHQATVLACLRHCPEPVYFIRCKMGYKRDEERTLASPQLPLLPDHVPMPEPKLRVVEATGSPAALESGIRVHQNMQVPEASLVARAFQDPWTLSGSGREALEQWQTSSGGPIGYGEVEVEVVRREDEVWALLRLGDATGPGRRL
jgi:hypothetical protein